MGTVVQLRCRVCGGPAPSATRCMAGCCPACHQQHCLPENSYGGHTLRTYAVTTPIGDKVVVLPGVVGYFDSPPGVWATKAAAQSPAATAAALAGSIFGWDCPGALVENYHADGVPMKGKVHDRTR